MSGKDAIFISGAVGLMILAVVLLQFWSNWRRRSLSTAGAAFRFRRLTQGETLPIVLVPLIARPNRTYFVILQGRLNGYEAAFFDLYCTSGKSWDYQSTVLVKKPGLTMPKFQLQTKQWLQAYQRTCGESLEVPGREENMASLRLSSEDPEWAREIFSTASPEFFEQVRKGKWTVEGFQNSIVIYRWGTRIAPRKLQEYVQQAGGLATGMLSLCSRDEAWTRSGTSLVPNSSFS